jgi:NitT/TauT family transport system permease protein
MNLARTGQLWSDTWASFLRITIGFLISTAVAVPVGVMIGTSKFAELAIEPFLGFVRYMPAVAFVPLTVIWFGVGEGQKWVIIFIGVFFSEALMVMDNVKRVPRDFVKVGRTLGYSDLKVLRRVVIPAAAPSIWDTLRINLGWAWTWLVVAELVAADKGLGARIVIAQRYLETETIFVAILMIGILGLLMDQVMKYAGRRFFDWAEDAQ